MDNIENLLGQAESALASLKAQSEREGEFAVEANLRFGKNILAFQKYFPDIVDILIKFTPREDFCLHVTSTGAANFYPKGIEVPLYNDDPVLQANEQVNRNIASPNFSRTDYFSAPNTLKEDKRLHIKYVKKLADILSQVQADRLEILTSLPKTYPTCMMFGVGLGYHIELLLDKCQFDYMYVCEPDIELFFASLFCIDWSAVIEKIDQQGGCLFLNVGSTYAEFFEDIRLIAEKVGANSIINSFCYQHYPSKELNLSIKGFFENYYQLHQGFGFYNDAITGLAHGIINSRNKFPYLFASPEKRQVLKDKSVFVVANGPSLDESIEFIKQNKDDAIIIAAGTALYSLRNAGIAPDFHVLVERTKGTYDAQVDFLNEGEDYSDLNLLAVDVMYPDVLKMYKWAGLGRKGPEAASVFLAVQSLKEFGYASTELPFCAPLVANTALAYAAAFGFGEIYMFGIDNGYHTNSKTHSSLSIYKDERIIKLGYKAPADANVKLPGNAGEIVMATKLMAISHIMQEKLIALFPGVDFYNVGSGAKVVGAHTLLTDELFLLNKTENKGELVEAIKTSFFQEVTVVPSEETLGWQSFKELCDYLIEIGNRPYKNRDEAHKLLRAQQNVLLAYKDSQYAHFFHLIKGTMLYFHCPMMTMLYFYEQEDKSLEWFDKTLKVWQEFIKAAQVDFNDNWNTKCTWSSLYQDE
ncbi:6-hydroxymethylpterin diphosphokinase MptE-like protein [Pseudoalteromonas sp. JC3]|uniref:motility associated factor glycosyltransferase family protein n=1 Tax=Pseudoalteromonas sp. JC3 TaxID=2810196 RepID=UPI0019D11422|nr:6-hydroxymethylpterin diphosphokinase MptE-like protein [Pseudoalteromonas sp. JC3]MBR8842637.1 motility associated factor glycosyltransferase family protein [Pseudoalteromonas sp. JC3]WJE10111.1 DUF115 domain-containing protein [Pseudoalteromonas sp. JC3]